MLGNVNQVNQDKINYIEINAWNNKAAILEQKKKEHNPLTIFFVLRPNFALDALEEASPGTQPRCQF